MPRETSAASVIDVCTQCEGIWVDWFDGDLPALVGEGGGLSRGTQRRGDDGDGKAGGCPRCRRPLVQEAYLGDGPAILRCGECAGAFVSRASAATLVYYQPEGRAGEEKKGDEGFLGRLASRIREALGIT